MTTYHDRSLVLERERKPDSRWSPRLLGHWLMSALRDSDPRGAGGGLRRLTRGTDEDQDTADLHLALRFPLIRRGYDPVAVEEYVGSLERELAALDHELAELRGQGTPDEIADQIQRVGEQTSAVLMAAHEQRDEILRSAKAEAERCVAEAAASAKTITEQTEARVRAFETQNEAARHERDRLVAEIRTISTGLASVADSVS